MSLPKHFMFLLSGWDQKSKLVKALYKHGWDIIPQMGS